MTKMILAAAFMLSASAHAAQDLVTYSRSAGFSPRPGYETVRIQEDGKVRFYSQYLNRKTNKKEITDKLIAKLSSERTAALKAILSKIKEDDLKDQDANRPRCMDAPSSGIAVGEIAIFRRESCHTWVNESAEAVSIKALVDGLVALNNL